MKSYNLSLPAGYETDIPVSGNFFRVLSGTFPLKIIIDDLGASFDAEVGLGFTLDQNFKKLRVVSDYAQDVEIVVGGGNVQDSRFIATGIANFNELGKSIVIPSVLTMSAVTGGYRVKLCDPDSDRTELAVSTPAGTLCYIHQNETDATAANGFPFQNSFSLPCNSSLWLFTTTNVIVKTMEVKI